MSKTRFAPGPWKAQKCYRDTYVCTEAGRSVAMVMVADDLDTEANSQFLAALPDLYEASEKALSALRQYRHFFAQRGMDYPAGVDVEECVIAALTKARGEE